ncbi:MAG: RNA polymerase sigma factor (sigma-70 family) [Pseudohongiellaceae bacterium]|jgi:RNA polymerase sigma factor (sigma-70 family)
MRLNRESPSLTCQLAVGARAGEAGVFDALHGRLSPSILAWARMPMHRHLNALMDPDDLVQDVWIRATRGLHSFDPTRGTFRQWIFKIAKNLSIDLLRQHSRAEVRGVPLARGGSSLHEIGRKSTGAPSTWLQVARSEAFTAFLQRVSELPHNDQLLLVHCGMEELPVAQVASRLEISEAAAFKRWQRLRARLIEQGLPEGIIEE